MTAANDVDLLIGVAVLVFVLFQRLILQARAQRIAGGSAQDTGAPLRRVK